MAPQAPAPDDPFAGASGDSTFIRPRPGGWTAAAVAGEPAPATTEDAPLVEHGLNPLVAAANRLLMLVPQLRRSARVDDPARLRASLASGVREFTSAAQQRGIAPERVMAARYVLCTALDEAAADTPWGGNGVWGRHSLLAEFHNEAFGGEKVFLLMARLAEQPKANVDLLELIYAAIALGFEGRYRVIEHGRAQLDAVRSKLAAMIRQQRGACPSALADHWQTQPVAAPRGDSWLPLAIAASSAALLAGGVYAIFALSLAGRSDPVYAAIQDVRLPPPVTPVAQPAPAPRLATLLQSDIRAGALVVRDEVDRSVVTVRGDGMFDSGSSTLAADAAALMRRVGEAAARIGGQVLVTGHTDDVPIRTLRFPSNWHLSDERARAVRELLVAAGVPADRITAEGRADSEPVASNDTPDNRSANRRVEITVFPARPEVASRASTSGAPAAPAHSSSQPAPR